MKNLKTEAVKTDKNEDESVFTYLPEDMPQCPYCSGRVEAPFTDQTIPWRGECSEGHSLLYQLDEEDCDSEESAMKTFLVKLHIQAGEYEKSSVHLVSASSPDEAEELAIRDESHNDKLYKRHGWTYENDDSFAYAANTITEIEDEQEKAVLKKYLYF